MDSARNGKDIKTRNGTSADVIIESIIMMRNMLSSTSNIKTNSNCCAQAKCYTKNFDDMMEFITGENPNSFINYEIKRRIF